MINSTYANALKEVSDILENTDDELLNRLPENFIKFIHENMNKSYKSNIDFNVDIDKQTLLYETSAILSLIYRSYWATDEEKKYLAEKDLIRQSKYDNFQNNEYVNTIAHTELSHTTDRIKKEKNLSKTSSNTNLTPIPKENIIIKFLKKIINIFKGPY